MRPRDLPPLDNQLRLRAEGGRVPEDEVRKLADLDRSNEVGEAMRDRRVDGVLRDIALYPLIVHLRQGVRTLDTIGVPTCLASVSVLVELPPLRRAKRAAGRVAFIVLVDELNRRAIFSYSHLKFHFMCGLPGPRYDLPDPTHGLAVTGNDADCAHVVKDVLRCDGLSSADGG